MYRKSKAKDQKAIDLKFLSTNEKQSHEIPEMEYTSIAGSRKKTETKSIIRSKLENLIQRKIFLTGSKPIAFQILVETEVQDKFQSKTKHKQW